MNKPILFAALAAGAAVLPVSAAPAQSSAARAERDWSKVVAATPEGGYRMGNPDAPVKVIEFLSLTCGHCAHFAEEGAPRLIENYVKTGRVSLEYRNFILNGLDLVAAVVSRCAAPADYFRVSDAMLGAQEQWIARIQGLTEAQRKAIADLGPTAGLGRVAVIGGLDAIAARHGVGAVEMQACLADESRTQKVIEMRGAAEQDYHIHGTPSFVINGKLAEGVHDWAALEPLLRPAGR